MRVGKGRTLPFSDSVSLSGLNEASQKKGVSTAIRRRRTKILFYFIFSFLTVYYLKEHRWIAIRGEAYGPKG